MRREDFEYELPPDRIAQYPLPRRGDSKLLCLDGRSGVLGDRGIAELPTLLSPGDLLVFNDTRVLRARLFGHKATGGRVELLVERVIDSQHAVARIRASKAPRPGTFIGLEGGEALEVLDRTDALYTVALQANRGFQALMERSGHVPLPPYIRRAVEAADAERYQTVYARTLGAVAAPTAGLHFDQALLDALQSRGVCTAFVTLHVGGGTFEPVREETIEAHRMHAEAMTVGSEVCRRVHEARARGGRIVAVGTTTLRALETAAARGEIETYGGETELFIYPGYRFRVVDVLLTNFHLPGSTLLMLVCAFAGREQVLNAYRHAISYGYRFYSYGDAMLLTRAGA
jgi:S-adenosylmethionine:tRNA ribosyltransferase-isomerase